MKRSTSKGRESSQGIVTQVTMDGGKVETERIGQS